MSILSAWYAMVSASYAYETHMIRTQHVHNGYMMHIWYEHDKQRLSNTEKYFSEQCFNLE